MGEYMGRTRMMRRRHLLRVRVKRERGRRVKARESTTKRRLLPREKERANQARESGRRTSGIRGITDQARVGMTTGVEGGIHGITVTAVRVQERKGKATEDIKNAPTMFQAFWRH